MEGLAARTVNSGLVGAEELIHDLFSNPYVYIHIRMGLVRNLVFEGKSTVIIRDKALQDQDGHQGSAGIHPESCAIGQLLIISCGPGSKKTNCLWLRRTLPLG